MRCGDWGEPWAIRGVSTSRADWRPYSFAFDNRHGPPFACVLEPVPSSLHSGANTSAMVPSFSQSGLVQVMASMLAPPRSAAGYPLVLGASIIGKADDINLSGEWYGGKLLGDEALNALG